MTPAAASGLDARASADSPPAPWMPPLVLAAIGASVAWAASIPVPDAPGAERCLAPASLLAVFDTSAALLLIRPGRRGIAETLALAALAAPFHAALAAAALAGPGLHVAFAISCAAWASMAIATATLAPRVAPLAAAVVAFALPLASYGLGEFARLRVAPAFLASPLSGPAVLGHRASAASAADAVPALVTCAIVTACAVAAERLARPGPERRP